ncbi:MAG: ribose-phosphate pyrophosphokinase [Candidatus Aureabacteria bacterium]|nr:ribose-phosphate pyrophosphokinase [Candidatus Auribacterota bacterium]
MRDTDLILCCGNSNRKLAQSIADAISLPLGDVEVTRFSEGEILAKINCDARNRDVFIVQPTCPNPNESLMELLIMIDAFKRASAARITAVLPYYAYARQDRKDQGRVPITAKLVANLITTSGANRVLAMDLHATQIQGFFDIPMDHLYSAPVVIRFLKNTGIQDMVVVSPDAGSIRMARAFSEKLGTDLAIVDKRRIDGATAKALTVIGNVSGKNVMIVDDIIATGGSLVEAASILKRNGANQIYAAVTHGVLSGPAVERIQKSEIQEMFVTDSIYHETYPSKIKVLSVAELLGDAIMRIHEGKSVSMLFNS